MSETGETVDCRKCGRAVAAGEVDRNGWCKACRVAVVRRSSWWAVLPAAVVAAAYFWVVDYFGLFQSTFLMVFIAIGAALAYVAWKVARRVLFDVIRIRAAR